MSDPDRKRHVRRCGACRNLLLMRCLPFPGIDPAEVPPVVRHHAAHADVSNLPGCVIPFCVAHLRIDARTADRVARLVPHERWIQTNGWRARRLPLRTGASGRPEGYEPAPCSCPGGRENPLDPCDKAGDAELHYHARGVSVHLSIWPPYGESVTARSAIQDWDRVLPSYRAWCLARWEELCWLASEDLRMDPSGRRFVRLGRGGRR
jgi:hypothetical protein